MAKAIDTKGGAARAQESGAEQMNAQQRAAVLHGEGPLLVVAGAGTGKTRVITERIRYLLETQPELAGEQILGLTFTDKAAGEMKWRVAKMVGERGKAVQLSTFHAFCDKILKEIDPEVRVLDPVDHWILLRKNLPLLKLEKYRRLAEPGQFLGDFVAFFSRCQDELVTPDDYQRYADELMARARGAGQEVEADAKALMLEEAARQQEIARAFRASEELLRARKLQTFGSMMMETVRLLDEDAAVAELLRNRFRYILVDEFQDTNIAQLELLWRLARDHRNIVAVGDDDQAIYRFRGASFGSFQIFLERFAGETNTERMVQTLTQNYRSTGRVLKTANQVIALNEKSELFPLKNLTASKQPGEKVRIVELANATQEARWVTAEIARLHEAGAAWRSFAMLYRAHTHRNLLVEELARAGIPFVIRNLTIFDNPLVRDLIAYLRLIATPSDDVACARVLAAPGWHFESKDLVRLAERARKDKTSLWNALEAAAAEKTLSTGARAAELVEFITSLRKRARKLRASELFAELAGELDLGVVASGDSRPYHERLAQFIREWEMKSETRRLAEFVEYLDYFQQAGGQINLEEETGADAVQLMTVHAAKGLEFDHVFILRMTRGAFPTRARTHLFEFPDELMKEQRPRGDFHIQEERRLFYVALTRAKGRLTLTAVVDNKRNKPSPFLDDILENAALARRDVQQIAPAAIAATEKQSGAGTLKGKSESTREGGGLFPADAGKARVFSNITKWAADYRPAISEPLQLSASAIETYRSCPQKYLFSNVWGLRTGPVAAISFGSVMHTTIKHFLAEMRKGGKVPFEEVEAIFEREWTPAGFEDDYQQAEYKRDGLEQLRAFHALAIAEPPEIESQEKSFELPLDDNIVITGRMDQINRIAPGQREIVDYKTGRPKTEESARKDIQLSVYALAAREVLEFDPARLVFHNLTDNSRVETTRGDKELNKTRETISETAASIRAGEFQPEPGFFQCRNCAFRPICPAHEQQIVRTAAAD
ncbi:MAG TPA: ATP-dependent DNA helicase [Candidatus Acidoferrum sp.]|nr:ATP-dependent DNA helicase [Candidatus Acidoferrum sp.]